jgi:branched-chain amino acid transport system substrate-binding protein
MSRLVVFVLVLSLLAGCAPAATPTPKPVVKDTPVPTAAPTEVPTVRLGIAWPFTGPIAATAQGLKDGVELIVEFINESWDFPFRFATTEGLPNLGGAKIEVFYADTQGTTDVGPAAVEQLITQDNVDILFCCYQSSVTKPSSDVAERYGVPAIGAECSSVTLTERGLKWFWRTNPSERQRQKASAEHLAGLRDAGYPINTIGLLIEDSEAGATMREEVLNFFPEHGLEIVADVQFPTGTTDLTAELLKIKQANPDVLFMQGYNPDYVLALLTLEKLDYAPYMYYGQSGIVAQQIRESAGKNFEYVVSQETWGADLLEAKPWVAEIASIYKARYGRDMDGEIAVAMVAVLTVADVANRAGSTDPESLFTALGETKIPADEMIAPWKGVWFDPVTHQNQGVDFTLVQWVDGAWHTIWPAEVKRAELVPLKPWAER